jgi:hypothetical protein
VELFLFLWSLLSKTKSKEQPTFHDDNYQLLPQPDMACPISSLVRMLVSYSEIMLNVSVSIGSDKQQVTVALDTGSPLLWVNPTCSNSPASTTCASAARYNPETSITAVKQSTTFNITYGLGSANGIYYTDQVAVGSASDPALQFGVANTSTYVPYGVLGLSPKSNKLSDEPFIYKLSSQGAIGSAAFALDLQSINNPNGKLQSKQIAIHSLIYLGSITFGGIDSKRYQCRLSKRSIIPAAQAPDGVSRYRLAIPTQDPIVC